MKTMKTAIIASSLFALAASSSAFASEQLTPAGQCVLDEYQEIFRTKAGTQETVDIYVDLIQQTCEEKTGTKVKDLRLLKKGPGGFSAGGTEFIFR